MSEYLNHKDSIFEKKLISGSEVVKNSNNLVIYMYIYKIHGFIVVEKEMNIKIKLYYNFPNR